MKKKEPIRVAQVVGKMVGGGLEATVLNYYHYIDRTKIQYDFLIDEDSTFIPEEQILPYGGRIIKVPPYQNPIKYHLTLLKLFREKKYQMVYSHLNTLSVFPLFAAWRAGIPIRIAHNHSTMGKGEFKKNIMKYALRPFSKLFPTHLCACSYFAGEWMFGKRTLRTGRVQIWQNAVQIDSYMFDSNLRDIKRKTLNIEDKFVIGHIGRFIHQKNHDFIIDIFNEIQQQEPNAVLLLVGDGNLMSDVKTKVKSLDLSDSVIFTGVRSDANELYQAMDVFLLPSFYEGLGMVAVEAQISGMPVFCADTVPEEAKICENMKYYSLDDSPKKWANHILQYKNGFDRADMRDLAEKAGYEINVAANKMTNWYESLIDFDS